MSKGMSHFVLVVYSNALASLILLPTSISFIRRPLHRYYLFVTFSKNCWSGCRSERVSIRDNVGFLILPLWVH
ncbi:hypothetical protein ES288_D12G081200v1 [Gossypium darwinii]|uniref:Uncharacterized protein n=1 Tax=Gossypium darwinii TaxID=34276 RepID=A0A5D2A7F6_GOSDA|nr:hypothetical protein ES288_D12G081200v1 [Gossypium darwinii]